MMGAPMTEAVTISGDRTAVPWASQNADMTTNRLQVVALTPSGHRMDANSLELRGQRAERGAAPPWEIGRGHREILGKPDPAFWVTPPPCIEKVPTP